MEHPPVPPGTLPPTAPSGPPESADPNFGRPPRPTAPPGPLEAWPLAPAPAVRKRSVPWNVCCGTLLALLLAFPWLQFGVPSTGGLSFLVYPSLALLALIRGLWNFKTYFDGKTERNRFALFAAISWFALFWTLSPRLLLVIASVGFSLGSGSSSGGSRTMLFLALLALLTFLSNCAVHRFSGRRRAADLVTALMCLVCLTVVPRFVLNSSRAAFWAVAHQASAQDQSSVQTVKIPLETVSTVRFSLSAEDAGVDRVQVEKANGQDMEFHFLPQMGHPLQPEACRLTQSEKDGILDLKLERRPPARLKASIIIIRIPERMAAEFVLAGIEDFQVIEPPRLMTVWANGINSRISGSRGNLSLHQDKGIVNLSATLETARIDARNAAVYICSFEGDLALQQQGGTLKMENVSGTARIDAWNVPIDISCCQTSLTLEQEDGPLRIREGKGEARITLRAGPAPSPPRPPSEITGWEGPLTWKGDGDLILSGQLDGVWTLAHGRGTVSLRDLAPGAGFRLALENRAGDLEIDAASAAAFRTLRLEAAKGGITSDCPAVPLGQVEKASRFAWSKDTTAGAPPSLDGRLGEGAVRVRNRIDPVRD